jgi:hypothetical protein
MRAAQPIARTRPEIPTPPRKTIWPGVAGERGAAGMTDRIRIARAAGIRKDRLFSSRWHRRRHVWPEAKEATARSPLFLSPNHRCADFRTSHHLQYPVCQLWNPKDTSILLFPAWLCFGSPHDGQAAAMMRTSEPPHQAPASKNSGPCEEPSGLFQLRSGIRRLITRRIMKISAISAGSAEVPDSAARSTTYLSFLIPRLSGRWHLCRGGRSKRAPR